MLIILLMLVYGVSSTGATVQLHYCCGKLKSIKLGSAPVKNCGMQHKMGSKPCCETKEIKAGSSEQQVYTVTLGEKTVAEAPVAHPLFPEATIFTTVNQTEADYSPPLITASRCIIHCVFRV